MAEAVTMTEEDERLLRILESAQNIAVVGLSRDPNAPSRDVAAYLEDVGYNIIPVNPNADEIMGRRCYPSVAAIPVPVDIVCIFRKPEDVPPVVEDAIRVGAKVIWMQLGITHEEAARRAREAGLQVIQDRCIMVEHRRLLGPRE